MSDKLIDEYPLLVLPSLACTVGLNEAVILQQIHYWLRHGAGEEIDDVRWVYNSYQGWTEQFPFLSQFQIGRAVRNLEKLSVLRSGQFSKKGSDRSKYYTIDYEALDRLEIGGADSKEPTSKSSAQSSYKFARSPYENARSSYADAPSSLTETTTKTTDREGVEQISSVQGGGLRITDDEVDEWDGIVWIQDGVTLHAGEVASIPRNATPKTAKRRRANKPVDEKKKYGKLPYEVQEKYREIFFPKGYDLAVQREIAFGHAKMFVETAFKYGFDDPVGLIDVIGREVHQQMVTTWPAGSRSPTIARLLERIGLYAQKTGRL